MKRFLIALALSLSLSGCGFVSFSGIKDNLTGAQASGNPLDGLNTFVHTDLEAALKLAQDSKDVAAMQCYPVLIGLLDAFGNDLQTQTHAAGAVSAFQRARNLNRSTSQSDLMTQINLGCAALFVSTQADVVKLLSKLSGIIGSGGASGLLGGGLLGR